MTKTDTKLVGELIRTDAIFRRALFSEDFASFFVYHYGWKHMTEWQMEWLRTLQYGKNIIIEAFRGSRKTTILRAFAAWCIIFRKEPFIIVQSYEANLSSDWVRQVAKMLTHPRIVSDHGNLFPFKVKREDIVKASFSNFEATTGVRIAAKSTGETIRGSNEYSEENGATRPTLLIMDDIDTTDSVRNSKTVDYTESKILGETFGALDQFRRRVILLANTIGDDGILPRFKAAYRDNPLWTVFHQPLIDETGKNTWAAVFTNAVIASLKGEGSTAFAQNYLLIPFADGDTIIRRDHIRYVEAVGYISEIRIGVDPASSEKTLSDNFAIVTTLFQDDGIAVVSSCDVLSGIEKETTNVIGTITEIYRDCCQAFPEARVTVILESVQAQKTYGDLLKAAEVATSPIHPTKDKVQRLLEKQYMIETGKVVFFRNGTGIPELMKELLKFPNAVHDDRVDAMVYSISEGEALVTVMKKK